MACLWMVCNTCSLFGKHRSYVTVVRQSRDGTDNLCSQCLPRYSRDARLLPHTTRVVNPYEIPDPPLPEAPAMLGVGATGEDRRNDMLPSEEWRETFLRRFKNFRKVRNLVQSRPRLPRVPPPVLSLVSVCGGLTMLVGLPTEFRPAHYPRSHP